MPTRFLIFLLVCCASALGAQQPNRAPNDPGKGAATAQNASYDKAKMAVAIRDSYYHPDDLTSLDCAVSIDWAGFFSAMKLTLPADRMKVIEGLKIRSRAVRSKTPEFTFDWTTGPLDSSEQFVSGLKQMMGGFYQAYWPMIAGSPVKDATDISKVEPLPNGAAKVYSSAGDTKVVMTVDGESTPTHFTMESPAMNGTIDPHYVASPKPIPGDLRRISGLDVTEQIGTSTMSVKLTLDYQEVDGFYVPKHVAFDIAGAYSLPLEFSSCSASKDLPVSK